MCAAHNQTHLRTTAIEPTALRPELGPHQLAGSNGQNGFRVPTHIVGVAAEKRVAARALLRLPVRMKQDGLETAGPAVPLTTRDISSTGVYFLSPQPIEAGTRLELEIGLVNRPNGRGNVRLAAAACVVRAEPLAPSGAEGAETSGWHGVAAVFEDFAFKRDEPLPARFLKP